jgi:hypothetical protein
MRNLGKYVVGLVFYYFSFSWWYIMINVYSMCNLDDVSWGNRPSNSKQGLNVVVDDEKRQEILKQSYRTTRTNILIWWIVFNVGVMFMFDSLILSALHNQNMELKSSCIKIMYVYACYNVLNQVIVLSLSLVHHIDGFFRLMLCSRFAPVIIYKRTADG